MADNTVITSGPSSVPSKSQGNSPWDDDLPEEAKKPTIVGSLDSQKVSVPGEKQPVPFNIPKDVISDKDKEQIPAEKIAPPPEPEKPVAKEQSASGVSALIQPKADPPPGPKIIHANNTLSGDIQKTQGTATPSPTASAPANSGQPPIAANPEPKPFNMSTMVEKPAKKGLFSGLFKGKETTQKVAARPSVSPQSFKDQTSFKQFKIGKSLYLVVGIVLILFIGIYLTEAGIASFGLEKVYGSFGLEGLWGGLSKSPDKALAVAVSGYQNDVNFKVKGKININATKSGNSEIVGPLLTLASMPMALADIFVGSKELALLSVADSSSSSIDYYGIGDTSDPSTDVTDYSTTDTTDTALDSSSAYDSSSVYDPSSSSDSTSGPTAYPQDTEPAYQTDTSISKTIDADVKAVSSDEGVSTDITINKIVGTQDRIQLTANKSDLYVKSDPTVKFAENYQQNKWLDFKFSGSENENIFTDLSQLKSDSGLAIVGSRLSNEKVGTTRCFRYNISNLELGDSLKEIGIDSNMVQKISGDIWIGISDKKIRKISFTIIPASSSAVTKIDTQLEFYDYGVKNSIDIPAGSDKISPAAVDSSGDSAYIGSTGDSSSTLPSATGDISGGNITTSNDSVRKSDLAKIKAALIQYKASYGRYPISEAYDRSTSVASILRAALVPTYLTALPSDPLASSGWWYGYKSSDGVSFTLSAKIEDEADPQTSLVDGVRLYYLKND